MKRLLLALLVILLAGCSSMQPVRVSDVRGNEAPAEIREGDRVEVTTRAGERFEFSVTEINAHGLGGEFGFIPYENMRQLRVRRPGSASDGGLEWLWAVLGAAIVIAVIASADSVSVCSPGPCPTPE
ncbi:MAG: hypothetical protein EHM68_08405 [Lysobacterales bacterium]|nr:MAG: hypothetical protein EHM68_08405 [Xanthomonadales bacterium]